MKGEDYEKTLLNLISHFIHQEIVRGWETETHAPVMTYKRANKLLLQDPTLGKGHDTSRTLRKLMDKKYIVRIAKGKYVLSDKGNKKASEYMKKK